MLALRATLAVVVTGLAVSALAKHFGLPPTTAMLGASVSMMGSISVKDGTRRGQLLTFAWLPVPVLVALTVGTLVAASPWMSSVALVSFSFLAVAAQRFGPRGNSLGVVGFNAMFFSLFFHAAIAQLGWLALAVLFGHLVAAVVRLLLLPDNPQRSVRLGLLALPHLNAAVLHASADSLERDTPWRLRRLRRALQQVNETALALEDHLEQAPSDYEPTRRQLFELELATERVIAGARDLRREVTIDATSRARWVSVLHLSAEAVTGDRLAAERVRAMAAQAAHHPAPETVQVIAARLQLALDDLFSATPANQATPAATVDPPSTDEKAEPAPEATSSNLSLRLATQAAVASALALFVGRWIESDRWYWAVLAAHVVVSPATSRGEIFVRAWRRSLGTVAGALLGMGLALVVRGHGELEVVMIFACVFLGLFSLKRAYGVFVFWFTTLLAILYSWQGRLTPELLGVRILETFAGAALGALSAWLVMPIHTGNKVRDRLQWLLRLTAYALKVRTLASIREVDRALRDLRAAAEPLTRGTFPVSRDTVEMVAAASSLAFYARQLILPKAGTQPTDTFAVLSQNAAALSEALAKGSLWVSLAPLPESSREQPLQHVLATRLAGTLGRICGASGLARPNAPTR